MVNLVHSYNYFQMFAQMINAIYQVHIPYILRSQMFDHYMYDFHNYGIHLFCIYMLGTMNIDSDSLNLD